MKNLRVILSLGAVLLSGQICFAAPCFAEDTQEAVLSAPVSLSGEAKIADSVSAWVSSVEPEKVKQADLNNDGFQESYIFFEGKIIIRVIIDDNNDGKIDGIIFYKNGFRQTGERDIDFNDKADTWIRYYMTGYPWIISRDKNGDSQPDYWKHVKNGAIYKREWDRNHDGKPDVMMLVPGKSDLREEGIVWQVLEKHFDDNYDGVYEKVVKIKKRMPFMRVQIMAGAIGET